MLFELSWSCALFRPRCLDVEAGHERRKSVATASRAAMRRVRGPVRGNIWQAVISLEATFHPWPTSHFHPGRTRSARGEFLFNGNATLETRVQRAVIIYESTIAYPLRNLFLTTPWHPVEPLCSVQSSFIHLSVPLTDYVQQSFTSAQQETSDRSQHSR